MPSFVAAQLGSADARCDRGAVPGRRDPVVVAAGVVTAADGRPVTLVGFTITSAKIVAIDLIDDPRRIAEADLAILGR